MLRHLACAWLVCQLTGFVAAPVAVCAGPVHVAADSEEHCCPGLAPGQICPMHQTRAGAKKCVMRNACSPSPAALPTLMGGLGLQPSSSPTLAAIVAGDVVVILLSAAIVRAALPESPPPRA